MLEVKNKKILLKLRNHKEGECVKVLDEDKIYQYLDGCWKEYEAPKFSMSLYDINKSVYLKKDNLDDNITYYTLVATTMSKTASDNYQKENDIVVKPEIEKDNTTSSEYYTFIPNEELTLGTYNGYFKSESSAVKIISLTADEVKFTIPFGVNEVNIYVKDSNNIIKYKYRKEV